MALRILSRWEQGTRTLDFILNQELGRTELSAAEKAEVTERVSNWGRGRGAARYLLETKTKVGLSSLPHPLRRQLELTVCRLLYEERTPKPIIVSAAVEDIKQRHGTDLGKLANAILRSLAEQPLSWPDAEADPVQHLAHSTSHPPWMVARWLDRYGEDRTRAQLNWDNFRPAIWLRWNQLRGDYRAAVSILKNAQVDVRESPDFGDYFYLESSFHPGAASLVEAGHFSVQDPSASLAVRLLDPQPGMSILDLCAAPGGKTTLMAERMGDRGRIVAVDSSKDRLKQLDQSLIRLGMSSVKTVAADARSFAQNPTDYSEVQVFDAVLVDVPCSGFGVLSRRTDLRWRRMPDDLADLVSLQKNLIRAAAACTKPGGVLVYSTCSIEPEENEDIIEDFLAEFDEFSPDDHRGDIPDRFIVGPGEVATYSPRDEVDGIYAARLKRQIKKN